MTPAEFAAVVDGERGRREREAYRAAWVTSHLLSVLLKKKITPEKLLGRVKAAGQIVKGRAE